MLFTTNQATQPAAIQDRSWPCMVRPAASSPSPTPARYIDTQAAISDTQYWPTLKNSVHDGFFCDRWETVVAPACSSSAGHGPHRYMIASTKAVVVTVPFWSNQPPVFTGRNSPSRTRPAITQKAHGIVPIAGCTLMAAAATNTQPTHTETCQVAANSDQRANDGRGERPPMTSPPADGARRCSRRLAPRP